MNNLKELLATYEKSIERKDQVISNLTHALQKQKDKKEVMRTFCEWKLKHNDSKREVIDCVLFIEIVIHFSCKISENSLLNDSQFANLLYCFHSYSSCNASDFKIHLPCSKTYFPCVFV